VAIEGVADSDGDFTDSAPFAGGWLAGWPAEHPAPVTAARAATVAQAELRARAQDQDQVRIDTSRNSFWNGAAGC
jgi:hypothetical protein